MSLATRCRHAAATLARTLYAALPVAGVSRPVFVVGCGRSGTTILGRSLSRHGEVTYLNEPRHLWFSAYPETDVWTPRAVARRGRLALAAEDAEPGRSRKLRRLFRLETVRTGKPILVEKLPANSFRLGFLHEIFPDARFVHIYRNGLEVAGSIETMIGKGIWFGADSYKWHELTRFARTDSETAALPELCATDFDKGLLEWRLNTQEAVKFLRHLPEGTCYEVSYEQLVNGPAGTLGRVLSFLGLEEDAEVLDFARDHVVRRTAKWEGREPSEKEAEIGGGLLSASMTPHGLAIPRQLG